MTGDLLELCDIRRVFPGFELGPLSLRLRPGRVYGLLGPNGAGKSTLLNLMALQLKPTTGTLCREGVPVDWGDRAWKTRVSYIREAPSFYDELTVAHTLELARRLHDDWDHELADTLVHGLGLQPQRHVGRLSKGTKVKLGIVTALAQRADLLLLDEPTAGLDPTARSRLQDTIRDLIRAHAPLCVVLSSHIFEDIEAAATDILILRQGRLVVRVGADTLRDSVLLRTGAPGDTASSPDLVLRWRRRNTTWWLVRRGSQLEIELRLRPDHATERPTSLIAALYHGTEHAHVG